MKLFQTDLQYDNNFDLYELKFIILEIEKVSYVLF